MEFFCRSGTVFFFQESLDAQIFFKVIKYGLSMDGSKLSFLWQSKFNRTLNKKYNNNNEYAFVVGCCIKVSASFSKYNGLYVDWEDKWARIDPV
jgi:hypothetical protein